MAVPRIDATVAGIIGDPEPMMCYAASRSGAVASPDSLLGLTACCSGADRWLPDSSTTTTDAVSKIAATTARNEIV